MEKKIGGPRSNSGHVVIAKTQWLESALSVVRRKILKEGEVDITFKELERRNSKLYNEIINKNILDPKLDLFI